jgi:4-amino-4-deoxy-L-arabinose transferase-like glycosyltransferase
MPRLIAYLRRYRDSRKHVRPWAIAVPILVLFICLPLLRPLRHPDNIADSEVARLATVQAMVERGTQALDFDLFKPERHVIEVGGAFYSSQPPVFSALLASAYWSMHRLGLTFERNPDLVSYLLTVLGTTLPAACIAGLVYRMGRLFELPRAWRTALGAVVVLGGVMSYATALNEHVPAATLAMCAAACLIHIALIKRRMSAGVWLFLAGLCVALAATFDVTAALFVPLLAAFILALPWTITTRLGSLALYVLGLLPPVLLHLLLTVPVTGDWRPGMFHPELAAHHSADAPFATGDDWDDDLTDNGYASVLLVGLGRFTGTLVGDRGLISHFPVVLLGLIGVSMVMHRHWPTSTKALAGASVLAAVTIVILLTLGRPSSVGSYASPSFIAFMPMLTFWVGAWLRRPHRPLAWTAASILFAFSLIATLIGATNPQPRDAYTGYTVADAFDRLVTGHLPAPSDRFIATRP